MEKQAKQARERSHVLVPSPASSAAARALRLGISSLAMVAPKVRKTRSKLTPADLAHEEALTKVEEQFRDFDLVWAKVGSYPWWPAVFFHSWDAVRSAGLPTSEKSLTIPAPYKVDVEDADGKTSGDTRVVRHCLVMFADQFNFSVVQIDPRSVVSYLAYYDVHTATVLRAKKVPKNCNRPAFRKALARAEKLLHMVGTSRFCSVERRGVV